MLGIDANAKLWGTTDAVHVGEQVLRATMTPEDRERAKALHSFIASRGLVAVNTFMNTAENEDLVTRTNWSGIGTSQIDFVLAAEAIDLVNIKMGDAGWFSTDHRPVICCWKMAEEDIGEAPARVRCIRDWMPSVSWEENCGEAAGLGQLGGHGGPHSRHCLLAPPKKEEREGGRHLSGPAGRTPGEHRCGLRERAAQQGYFGREGEP
jgi:hypothetical protein